MATIDATSHKENTALIYSKNKSDDTTLDKNLFDFTTYLKKFNTKIVVSDVKRLTSTRLFVDIGQSVKTSLHKSSKTKEYFQILGTYEFDNIKVRSFVKELEHLSKNNSDSALVFIFDNLDEWHPVNDLNKFEKLFLQLTNLKFNEDIYISLLASTILLKNNPVRKQYFKYVENELGNIYGENDLSKLLIGL